MTAASITPTGTAVGPIVICQLCHQYPAERPDGLCTECGQWHDYWESLTPVERLAELASMDAYVDESQG